jgi:Predicted membrane protein (DUF2142)
MPDDLAVLQLDEPAEEPIPATSGRARGIRLLGRLLGRPHRDRGGPSGLAAWLLVAIAAVGLLASTPPSAGPDEPIHEVTAWYDSGNILPPRSTVWFSVPASLWLNPCSAGLTNVTAGCMEARSMNRGMVATGSIVDYPPPYYWVVGVGERLAALVGTEYADIGGRVASIVLNLGVLFLLSLYMRRRNPLWGNFLLLVSTPMAVFLGIVVGPSGWEVTCALAMAVALSEAAWSRPPVESEAWSKSATAILVLASIGLSTARPIGFLWACGLTVSAIALAPTMNRRTLARAAAAVAPGIVLGILWLLTHSTSLGTPTSPSTVPNLVNWFAQSLLTFPEFLRQMFGVLGWLDTPMPGLLFLVNVGAWAVLLTRLPSIRRAAILCGVFGIVIVPSAIEAIGWAAYPAWWQGRYTLPFAAGFVLLLLLRSGRLIPRTISAVSGIAVLSLGIMVWVNAIRYGFGLNAYALPASLANPGLSTVRLVISAAAGLLLVLISGYLLVRAWRTPPDFRPALEPEILPSPSVSSAG